MNTSPRVIGLAGSFAAGKDSLAHFLEETHAIKHISTSDIVREKAKEKYGSVERPILYKTANELRDQHGSLVLGEMALQRYEDFQTDFPGGVCVSGFRAWGEAEVIKRCGGIIVFVDAPAEVRYQRTISRARDGEMRSTFEEFLAREAKENGGVNKDYSIIGIKDRADIVLDNSGDIEQFLQQASEALSL